MKECKVLDCNKEAKARGLCGTHYSQLRRTGDPLGSLKRGGDPTKFTPTPPAEGCSVEGCERDHFCKGLCSLHYGRKFISKDGPRTETLEERRTLGLCSKCGENPRREDNSWCQPCINESSRKWNASEAGPRWRRYKLKKADIEAKKLSQDNACVICFDSFEEVADHVDHDNRCCAKEKIHNGGTCGNCVRDLLCGSCNQGLGNFKDDPIRLISAIRYLKKWGIE